MNKLQKGVLVFFVFMSLLIGLFPPWRYDMGPIHRGIGFHFLYNKIHIQSKPGADDVYYYEPHIETAKIAVEWITLILVSFGSFTLAKGLGPTVFRNLRMPRIALPKPIEQGTEASSAREKAADKVRSGISPWLKKFVKFVFIPLISSAVLGGVVDFVSSNIAITVGRGLLYTGLLVASPIALAVVGLLTFLFKAPAFPRVSSAVSTAWKTYIATVVSMVGFTLGAIAIELTLH